MGVKDQSGGFASKGLCLFAVCALFAVGAALDHTHVKNFGSKDICATTFYPSENSQFVNRRINAHNSDVDEYASQRVVSVEVWALQDGQDCTTATGKHNTITIHSDASISLRDSSDGGLDVFDIGTQNQFVSASFAIYSAPSFVVTHTNQGLPDQVRTATLQDVQNPNLDITKVGLSSESIAELVDGWITGSDRNYSTGTGDDQSFNARLAIFDSSLPTGFPEYGFDAIPLAADPNQQIQNRFNADEDLVFPSLQQCPKFSGYTKNEKASMQKLIEMWEGTGIDATTKQRTFFTKDGFRLDQQLNGPVERKGVKYLQLAVQKEKLLYAAAMIPVGKDNTGKLVYIPVGGIRKSLFDSLDNSKMMAFTPSPTKPGYWVLVSGTDLCDALDLIL